MRGQGPSDAAGSGRVTFAPELNADEVQRLSDAFERRQAPEAVERRNPLIPEKHFDWVTLISVSLWAALVLAFFLALGNSKLLFGFVLPISLVAILLWLFYRCQVTKETERARAQSPACIIAEFKGDYVAADMLDWPSSQLLGRAQRAVDTVLGSSLHQQGLLLDEARNRVILADVEWSLAQSLLQQTRVRHKINNTPTPGERSRQAAERARAVLEEDVAEVEGRARTLEVYADKVRAAELEEQDRRAAAEFEAIADRAAEAQAIHPQQNEALSSLVQAQDLALQVEALSPASE